MELETKLLKERESERDALSGLELTDGQPLNEHITQMKAKYNNMVHTLERDMKANTDKVNALEMLRVATEKKLKDATEERNELRDKLTSAKDMIKKEREENRNK